MTTQTMHYPELPGYLTVKMTTTGGSGDEGSVKVTVHSTIHINRTVELPNTWTPGYVERYPNRFRAEILDAVVRRYSLTLNPPTYS